ncbi:MAG: M56 family metallopeptidase [Firmicutes bacterium]|nr:M56 family metallopeptidase [Bacillota bacterium]
MLSFLIVSLTMSLIILGFLAASFLIKIPARLRYFAWIIILVGLAIPIRPKIGNGLFTIEVPSTVPFAQPSTFAPPPTLETSLDYSSSSAVLNFADVIAIIWLVVAVAIFVYHMWKYLQFTRFIRRWSEPITDENTLSILRQLHSKIAVKQCDFVATSMLVGFFKPTILLPNKHFDNDELELIFRHELVHYRRGDLYVKLLTIFVTAMHWFNPVIYLMNSAMQADCEASCDAAVLAVLQNNDSANRQFYAELIMEMIGNKGKKSTSLSTCFYGGKRGIKIRMSAIMSNNNNYGNIKKAVFFTIIILSTVFFSGSVLAFSPQAVVYRENFAELSELVDLSDLSNELGEISATQARDIALAAVGGGELVGLFNDYNLDIYRIEISHENTRYYLAIDSNTGDVMIYHREEILENSINWTQAVNIALSHTGGGEITNGSMEITNGQMIFMFTIANNNLLYDVFIGGLGELLLFETVLQ